MRFVASLVFACALLIGAASPRLAHADSLSAADQATFRDLISGQIQAFQHDDGAAAYGYASPTIQGLFQSPDRFMAMVKNGYPPVYRPQSVTFGPLADGPNGPLQKVFLVGPDGRNWVAIYALQRQPDGTWKINGCTLVEDQGATI